MSFPCRLLVLLLACVTLSACATNRAAKKGPEGETPEAVPAPTPKLSSVGTISMVNEELGFALIDSQESLAPGTRLKSFASQDFRETGTLTVNPEQSYPFFTAEITGGEPHPGDRVGKP